jgi:hypothetical protein
MFIEAIETFRSRTNDIILYIDENAESDKNYMKCCDFLDEFCYDDNDEIRILNYYVTFGHNGNGIVHKRLLDILVLLCDKYSQISLSSINNKSYCDSMPTSFERAEHCRYF